MARFWILSAVLLLVGCSATAPDPRLPEIARSYRQYGYVDDIPRVAPTMCKAPTRPASRVSTSRDEATHGRKTYFLFAKDRLAYLHAKDLDQPDGQVVVKESWIQPFQDAGPLFIMLKSGGDWTYATLTPDGKEVTAWGRLASCIECHESESTRDRMFGLTSCAAAK